MVRRLAIAFGLRFDPYQVLGISPGASPAEIREAYHRVAKKYHPDRGGDDWAFRVVLRAYETLTDERDSPTEIISEAESVRVPAQPGRPRSTATESVDQAPFDWSAFNRGSRERPARPSRIRIGFRLSERMAALIIILALAAITITSHLYVWLYL